jgi:hypothetical protein
VFASTCFFSAEVDRPTCNTSLQLCNFEAQHGLNRSTTWLPQTTKHGPESVPGRRLEAWRLKSLQDHCEVNVTGPRKMATKAFWRVRSICSAGLPCSATVNKSTIHSDFLDINPWPVKLVIAPDILGSCTVAERQVPNFLSHLSSCQAHYYYFLGHPANCSKRPARFARPPRSPVPALRSTAFARSQTWQRQRLHKAYGIETEAGL